MPMDFIRIANNAFSFSSSWFKKLLCCFNASLES